MADASAPAATGFFCALTAEQFGTTEALASELRRAAAIARLTGEAGRARNEDHQLGLDVWHGCGSVAEACESSADRLQQLMRDAYTQVHALRPAHGAPAQPTTGGAP